VRRDGLFEAVELDQDGALGDSGVMRHDPTATDEGPTAPGLDGRRGRLVVGSQLLGIQFQLVLRDENPSPTVDRFERVALAAAATERWLDADNTNA
jgi:hypothetical protein